MKKNIIILTIITVLIGITSWVSTNLLQKSVISTQQKEQAQQQNPDNQPSSVEEHKQETPIANFKDYFVQQLKQEEEEIWQALAQMGITKERYEREYNQRYANYLKSDVPFSTKPVSPETRAFVQQILQKEGINPAHIGIYQFNDFSPAAATDNFIYVCENAFNKLSHAGKEFVICHEVQHMLHKDNSNRFILEEMVGKETGQLAKEGNKNHPLLRLSRFKERRADIRVALRNPNLSHAYVCFAKEYYNTIGETPGFTHPKNSVRVQLAQTINDAMHGKQPYNLTNLMVA